MTTIGKSNVLFEGMNSILLSHGISNIKTDCIDISNLPFLLSTKQCMKPHLSVPQQPKKGIEITTWQGNEGVGV